MANKFDLFDYQSFRFTSRISGSYNRVSDSYTSEFAGSILNLSDAIKIEKVANLRCSQVNLVSDHQQDGNSNLRATR